MDIFKKPRPTFPDLRSQCGLLLRFLFFMAVISRTSTNTNVVVFSPCFFLFLGHFDCYALIQHGYFTQRNCCNKQYTSVRPLVYEAEINLLKTVLAHVLWQYLSLASPKFTKWPVFQMSRPPFPTLTKPCVAYSQPYQISKM